MRMGYWGIAMSNTTNLGAAKAGSCEGIERGGKGKAVGEDQRSEITSRR
jgi:hypothetical protein